MFVSYSHFIVSSFLLIMSMVLILFLLIVSRHLPMFLSIESDVFAPLQIADRTKLKGHTQAVGIATVGFDKGLILLGEGEVGDQVPVRNVTGESGQPLALFGVQKGTGHHVASSVIKKGVGWRRI